MGFKEIMRNLYDKIYYAFATWLFDVGGWIQDNKLKLLGLVFLIFAGLFCFLPTSEAKVIALIAFVVLGFALIINNEEV